MSDHIPDVTKMIGETPRMKAARNAAMEHSTGDVWRVGCDIECELNAANAEIEEKRKDIVYLATEKAKLENYVMRLEVAGDRMASILKSTRQHWYSTDQCEVVAFDWNEAKEAKL